MQRLSEKAAFSFTDKLKRTSQSFTRFGRSHTQLKQCEGDALAKESKKTQRHSKFILEKVQRFVDPPSRGRKRSETRQERGVSQKTSP